MVDPRLIGIELDESTILRRSADVEQERMVAIADLIEENRFAPVRPQPDGYAGPYRLALSIREGRLVLEIRRADGTLQDTHILALGRLQGPVRDYLAICDVYYQALRGATVKQIETVDMARRGLHNDAAELLLEQLAGKVEVDFATARRLFVLVSVLHIKG